MLQNNLHGEINPDNFGWKADQKKSRRSTKRTFDWPWKYLSNKKDYYNIECQFPFYLDESFGEYQGWHDQCVKMSFVNRQNLPLNDFLEENHSYFVCRVDKMLYQEDSAILALCNFPDETAYVPEHGIWSEWSEPECPACGKGAVFR